MLKEYLAQFDDGEVLQNCGQIGLLADKMLAMYHAMALLYVDDLKRALPGIIKDLTDVDRAQLMLVLLILWGALVLWTWAWATCTRFIFHLLHEKDGRLREWALGIYAAPTILYRLVNFPASLLFYGLDIEAWTKVEL
jgi:hypothetical protein